MSGHFYLAGFISLAIGVPGVELDFQVGNYISEWAVLFVFLIDSFLLEMSPPPGRLRQTAPCSCDSVMAPGAVRGLA